MRSCTHKMNWLSHRAPKPETEERARREPDRCSCHLRRALAHGRKRPSGNLIWPSRSCADSKSGTRAKRRRRKLWAGIKGRVKKCFMSGCVNPAARSWPASGRRNHALAWGSEQLHVVTRTKDMACASRRAGKVDRWKSERETQNPCRSTEWEEENDRADLPPETESKWKNRNRATSHLLHVHHEISKHDSLYETRIKVKLLKCLRFKFKHRHVNDSLHIKPRY
jgi:hypothetical protein